MPVTLFVTIGIPGSGKSTWAKTQTPCWRVNRDDIRESVFGYRGPPIAHMEEKVTRIQNSLILEGLRSGSSVIVDNTNLVATHRNALKKLAHEAGVEVLYKEIFFDTPVVECHRRNNERSNPVPSYAMERFIKAAAPYYSGKLLPVSERITRSSTGSGPNLDGHPAVVCDLDGTLCDLAGRNPYDPSTCDKDLPVRVVLEALEGFYAQGKAILFVSGREEIYRPQTLTFLNRYVKFPYELYMRPGGDMRPDPVIKREIYDQFIANKYRVDVVLDDRPRVVRMWRYDLGLKVFQLNDKEF